MLRNPLYLISTFVNVITLIAVVFNCIISACGWASRLIAFLSWFITPLTCQYVLWHLLGSPESVSGYLYASLFAAIGTIWVVLFALPDLDGFNNSSPADVLHFLVYTFLACLHILVYVIWLLIFLKNP